MVDYNYFRNMLTKEGLERVEEERDRRIKGRVAELRESWLRALSERPYSMDELYNDLVPPDLKSFLMIMAFKRGRPAVVAYVLDGCKDVITRFDFDPDSDTGATVYYGLESKLAET